MSRRKLDGGAGGVGGEKTVVGRFLFAGAGGFRNSSGFSFYWSGGFGFAGVLRLEIQEKSWTFAVGAVWLLNTHLPPPIR